MFLRSIKRKKNGKTHVYWNIVRTSVSPMGAPFSVKVLYLGEITSRRISSFRSWPART